MNCIYCLRVIKGELEDYHGITLKFEADDIEIPLVYGVLCFGCSKDLYARPESLKERFLDKVRYNMFEESWAQITKEQYSNVQEILRQRGSF